MIVTIDGPAGAGKSTVARDLARRLRFRFLDTGAMYRAVALAGLEAHWNWQQLATVGELARELAIEICDDRVILNNRDVSQAIRTSEVTAAIRYVAGNPLVRDHLVELQRQFVGDWNVVTEGRDQGTVVFPDAECKIFLTASAEERARRRVADLKRRGETASFSEVLAQQEKRDREDRVRQVGPLRQADDAVEVVTDGMTQEQVVDRLEALVMQRFKN